MAKSDFILIIVVLLFISNFWTYDSYRDITQEFNELADEYNIAIQEKTELLESHQELKNHVFYNAEQNCTAVTIEYYTTFSQNQQIISISVPYEKYDAYHKKDHPYWGELDLTAVKEYITSNETIINNLVETIRAQTQSQEDLANALLNFVQDKGNGLSVRYYPTTELKYPIETLVEMGGDCDTHSILYGTLMKVAGFKVVLLLSNETVENQFHVAIAVHLVDPPTNSLTEYADYSISYNGEEYYYAETTTAHWRVGDLPPTFENMTFNLIPL